MSSYFSESGYFFSTITNIYGYAIRGTKEEWKIVLAIFENLGFFCTKLIKNYNCLMSRESMFITNKNKPILLINENSLKNAMSFINNYYNVTLMSRLSPILTLCSKSYVFKNDYIYNLKLN